MHIRFRLRNGYLYCRIIVNSKRCNADFSINERVLPTQWDTRRQLVLGTSPEANIQNARLASIRAQIKALDLDLSHKGKPVNATLLKDLFLGKKRLSYSFIEVCRKHQAFLKLLPSDEVTQGTIDTYRFRMANVIDFLTVKGLTHITCEEFTPTIARAYIQYLRVERVSPMTQNTASKNMQLVKKIIRWSINQEWSKENPLQAFVIKKPPQKLPPHLSMEERKRIEDRVFPINRLQKIKDVFVFCCHTGLSFADCKRLRFSQHINREGNVYYIDMSRLKTGVDFYVPLTKIAWDILQSYGGEALPVPSNPKFNAYLKEVQDFCEISINLTARVARTTFGVIMLNDEGVPLETVSKMLGHASVKITEKHYARVLKRKVIRDVVDSNPDLYTQL